MVLYYTQSEKRYGLINNMNTVISKNNYHQLIRGASIFTTGGGIPIKNQLQSLKKLKNLKTRLLSLDKFLKNSYLCTAAELGPTDVPPLKKDKVIKKMLNILSKIAGVDIAGLYPPEIGQESVILESAHFLNLPVADFDPVGFRAVPFLDINIFNLKGIKSFYTPMVISNEKEEIFLIDGNISYERLEKILRQLTQTSNLGVIFLLGGVIPVKQLLKMDVSGNSYQKAIKFGDMANTEVLLQKLKPRILIKAVVIKKESIEERGFFAEVVHIEDNFGKKYKLIVLNEVIFILGDNNKIVASVPDRILLFDSKNLCGISGANISKNMPLTILVIDSLTEWQTEAGKKIFGQKRFKFLLNKLPKP